MRRLLIVATILLSVQALAADGGFYLARLQDRVNASLAACGLELVDGQHPGLDYRIRARRADYVVVKNENGILRPGVLVDQAVQGNDLQLTYMRTNGGHIMTARRDFEFNDFAVDTVRQGRVLFTRSYFRGRELETRFYQRVPNRGQREVSEASFARFLDFEVADGFTSWVCAEANGGH